MTEFDLSEKIHTLTLNLSSGNTLPYSSRPQIDVMHVKEFIRCLKEDINPKLIKDEGIKDFANWLIERIDKLAGKELTNP